MRDKLGRFVKGEPSPRKGTKKPGWVNQTSFKKGVRNNPSGEFKKGHEPKNKGQVFLPDDKHWNWSGDKVKYFPLHSWITRKLGKAVECANCGKKGWCHWHNISGQYNRDLTDWISLCPSCHHKAEKGFIQCVA